MGWPYVGVADALAAAGLQLRGVAQMYRAQDAYWTHEKSHCESNLAARAALHRHRDAEKQPDRLRYRVLCDAHGICPDLAHLVAGCRRTLAPTPCLSGLPGGMTRN